MTKAIFLDRDGVIVNNRDHYYIWKQDQLQYLDSVIDNLQYLSRLGYQLYIVSNQGGISKGLYTKDDILKLHESMVYFFRKNQVEIADIAFCPHHNEIEKCLCRKPESLMIEKLIAKHRISKSDSYFIGDSETDMIAAQHAGIRGIRITANENMSPFISFLKK